MQNNTIIAQATPIGPGAIALIRLSGRDAIEIAEKGAKIPQGKKLSQKETHTISYGWVTDSLGNPIDQVLFLLMQSPQTFTGENVVEITCHNNQLIISAIIDRYIQLGARYAERGEFTRRAVENQKISLLQAEAIQELISAQSNIGIKKSLEQLAGTLSYWVANIEKRLVTARALCEASFEFLEEEYDPKKEIKLLLTEIKNDITQAQKQFGAQKQIREGIRIALVGSTNAGKSSLLNAFTNQERAIVTPIEGTTRDTVETTIINNAIAWTLIDTAGIRKTHDPIESAGIARTYAEAEKADIVLLLIDGQPNKPYSRTTIETYKNLQKKYPKKSLIIQSKADKNNRPIVEELSPDVLISSTTKAGLKDLENKIQKHLNQIMQNNELPFSLNTRHIHALTQINSLLESAIKTLNEPIQNYEILSIILQDALECCNKMSGQEQSKALLDAVFSQFCVGK